MQPPSPLELLGLLGAAILGALAAVFRRYYMQSNITEVEYMPVEPANSQTPPYEPTTTESTPTAPPAPPQSMLERFCLAIRDHEGQPGDANYRNCNPGNFRCSPVGYAAKYGNVKCSKGGFAIFPTYQLGWEYLTAQVQIRAKKHPEWTIVDFFKNYAPVADGNDPIHYANVVAKRCGVVPTTTMDKLFS